MKSKWLDKKLSAKENMKDNKMLIYLILFYFIIGSILYIISVITKNPNGGCGVIGMLLFILSFILIIVFFLKSFILTKKMTIINLKNKNFTQKDLDLLDNELDKNEYKEITIKKFKLIFTNNYLIKNDLLYNKVDIFKISHLYKIIYWYSGYHIPLDKEFTPDQSNGLIEFYDINEEEIFAFNELREDCEKILQYFKENRKDIVLVEKRRD